MPTQFNVAAAKLQRTFYLRELGLASGADASAALATLFTKMKVNGGKASGTLVIDDHYTLSAPVIFDGGYTDVTAGFYTAAGPERFRLVFDGGSLTPTAGIGAALTISGFHDPRIEAVFNGGGQAGDAAVLAKNLLNPTFDYIGAEAYLGTVFKMDATTAADSVLALTCHELRTDKCGQTISVTNMTKGNVGDFGKIIDMDCVTGMVFTNSADVNIESILNFSSTSQTDGLLFDLCTNVYIDLIDMGDRPTGSLVRIKGSTSTATIFGRINTLRATGSNSFSPGTACVTFEEIGHASVGYLKTKHSPIGIHVIGGAANGLHVGYYYSETGDTNPIVIDPGSGTTPRVTIRDGFMRFHTGETVIINSGLTAGAKITIGGRVETPNTSGAGGKYAVDCKSAAALLDITGLDVLATSNIVGTYTHPTPSNVKPPLVQLGGVSEVTSRVTVSNTTTETAVATYTIPASSTSPGSTFRITASGLTDNIATSGTLTARVRVGGVAGTSLIAIALPSQASLQTGKSWICHFDVVVRDGSTSGSLIANGLFQSSVATWVSNVAAGTVVTGVNMHVDRDLVLDFVWATADPGNAVYVDTATIEQVR